MMNRSVPSRRLPSPGLVLLAALAVPGTPAIAADDAAAASEPAREQSREQPMEQPMEPGWWDRTKILLDRTWREGSNDLYLTGYSYHSRSTYSDRKIDDFNEFAYGGGYGRTWTNEAGNDNSIYGMVFADSHEDPQPVLGYTYQWMWEKNGFRAGAGLTGGLTARSDYSWIPFPFILPVASIGTRDVSVMATYVPPNVGNTAGNVLFIFGKFNLDPLLKK